MSTATPPACKDGVARLRRKLGRGYLAALTQQESSALTASLHVLELYTRADERGQRAAVAALGALVGAMQPHGREVVRAAIAFVLGEQVQPRLWLMISMGVQT